MKQATAYRTDGQSSLTKPCLRPENLGDLKLYWKWCFKGWFWACFIGCFGVNIGADLELKFGGVSLEWLASFHGCLGLVSSEFDSWIVDEETMCFSCIFWNCFWLFSTLFQGILKLMEFPTDFRRYLVVVFDGENGTVLWVKKVDAKKTWKRESMY